MGPGGTNPKTPLAMTAQAELAEWGESVNNAEVTATLERVSARIDLKVDEQAGLTFEPTKIEMAAAANSYIFPNTAVYEGEETVPATAIFMSLKFLIIILFFIIFYIALILLLIWMLI